MYEYSFRLGMQFSLFSGNIYKHSRPTVFVYISRKLLQYRYQPEYHRAIKTAPYTTNGDNNHSTKVHKNSYI